MEFSSMLIGIAIYSTGLASGCFLCGYFCHRKLNKLEQKHDELERDVHAYLKGYRNGRDRRFKSK